jgi:hypothetical protein
MIDKSMIIDEMLSDFFKKIGNDSQQTFISSLNDDFDKIMKQFNDYIVHKNLQMDSVIHMIDLHETAKKIIDEVCAYKIRCIKMHHQILSESTERAKQMAMTQKKGN